MSDSKQWMEQQLARQQVYWSELARKLGCEPTAEAVLEALHLQAAASPPVKSRGDNPEVPYRGTGLKALAPSEDEVGELVAAERELARRREELSELAQQVEDRQTLERLRRDLAQSEQQAREWRARLLELARVEEAKKAEATEKHAQALAQAEDLREAADSWRAGMRVALDGLLEVFDQRDVLKGPVHEANAEIRRWGVQAGIYAESALAEPDLIPKIEPSRRRDRQIFEAVETIKTALGFSELFNL